MDFWPRDSRKCVLSASQKKKRAIETLSYPLVTHNVPNLVTLIDNGGRFEWTSICKEQKSAGLRASELRVAFPPTCPPPVVAPKLPPKQLAERGANFMGTYYPDVVVPSDLIGDLCLESDKQAKELSKFDPLEGSLLGSIAITKQNGGHMSYLAFPMGENRSDLNLSPLCSTDEESLVFRPSAKPVKTFQTPILQISAPLPSKSQDRCGSYAQDPFVAIRMHSRTVLFKSEAQQNSHLVLLDVATVSSSDVGNCPIVDVKLNSQLDSYIVNDRGAVYHGSFAQGHNYLNGTRPAVYAAEASDQGFWRVALGSGPSECILTSRSEAHLLDVRANTSLELYTLGTLQDAFTSLEDESSDGILRLCTTGQLLWIDKRYPTRPLLGLKHGRNFDYTLQTNTIGSANAITILTSRKNSLMTIYDVSRLDSNFITLHDPPHCLQSSSSSSTRNLGQLFFQSPYQNSQCITLFQLYERGNITSLDLSVPSQRNYDTVIEWSAQMQAKADACQEDIKAFDLRDRWEVDFSMAYEQLLQNYEERREKVEEAEAQSIYHLIEQAPLFWRAADMPEERILTAYEVLFYAAHKPPPPHSTSDFLSDSNVNSERVYKALAQGRLSSEMLGQGSGWHCDISPFLRHFIPEATQDVKKLVESLVQGSSYGPSKPENRAKEQLALDLVLASSIYSGHPLANPRQASALESLTETLSLSVNGSAPPIQFGYLRPTKQKIVGEIDEDANKVETGSLGARLLLNEWTIGTDPRDYVYRTPHEIEGLEHGKQKIGNMEVENEIAPSKLVRPPTIYTSGVLPSSPFTEPKRREISTMIFSQGPEEVTGATAFSQEPMASTQIVPGPYGGRPVLGKKKPTKKRLGGF